MSRHMIDANKRLFAKLAGSLPSNNDVGPVPRYVATKGAEKQWLKEAVFSLSHELVLGDRQFFAFCKYRHERFVISVGDLIQDLPSELEECDANAGIVTAILAELDIPVVNAPEIADALRQYVFFPSTDVSVKYEAAEIRRYFEPFRLLRVLEKSANDDEYDARLSVLLAARVQQTHRLQYLPTTLELCDRIARDSTVLFPFHLLTRSLLERRWEYVFLAIYRCIEQLYPIKSAAAVRDRLNVTKTSAGEVAFVLEDVLSWRKKEDEALHDLFKSVNHSCLSDLRVALCLTAQSPQSIARAVYRLRNDCVHFRPYQAQTLPTKAIQWAQLVDALLQSAAEMYAEHSIHLRASG